MPSSVSAVYSASWRGVEDSRSSPRSTWVMCIIASSTGLTSVYSGWPLALATAKSGTCSVWNVMSPRTRSSQVSSPSGIRKRLTGWRSSARNAATCSSVSSRQNPSYPCSFEPAALRRASTSSLVQ